MSDNTPNNQQSPQSGTFRRIVDGFGEFILNARPGDEPFFYHANHGSYAVRAYASVVDKENDPAPRRLEEGMEILVDGWMHRIKEVARTVTEDENGAPREYVLHVERIPIEEYPELREDD